MPFKTFAPGVLTASDVNTFLMQQAVITCTSTTRPASPVTGMTIFETNTQLFKVWDGSAWQDLSPYIAGAAWTSFTPTIAAASTGWALGNGTATGSFLRVGRLIVGRMRFVFGSTSTFGATGLQVDLPVASSNTSEQSLGVGNASDQSASVGIRLIVRRSGGQMIPDAFQSFGGVPEWIGAGPITSTTPFTWNGTDEDRIGWSFTYEASS
jgi:hypothetical protein